MLDTQHSICPIGPGFLVFLAFTSTLVAQVPVAQLDALRPAGGRAGETLTLQAQGSDLDELSGVLVSDPEIRAVVENGEVRLEIPENLSPRIVDLAVSGRFGISNPRAFAVGNLPEVTESGDHRTRKTAQPIEMGQTVNATSDAAAIDWYTFTPSSTDPVAIDVLAERLDSRMDPTVVILDARGRELDRFHDVRGRDVSTTFTPPEAGEPLFVGVHDFLYEGGTSHFYRLTLGGDLSSTAGYPTRRLADLPVAELGEKVMPYAAGLEVDSLPASIGGVSAFHDRPVVDLLLAEAGAVVVEVFSERLDDPSDFRLTVDRVLDGGKLKRVAEDDDIDDPVGNKRYRLGSRDPVVRFNAEAGVRYRATIRNQFRTGGKYRLEFRRPRPDVHLIAAAEKPRELGNQLSRWVPVLRRGGTVHWEILALRRDGFDGPITVRAENLPEGVEAPDLIIGKGHHSGAWAITASAEAPAFTGLLSIVGEMEIEGRMERRRAHGAGLLWTVGDSNRERWESRLMASPMLTILAQETEPITLVAKETELKSCLGGKLEIPFRVKRLLGQSGNFKLSLYGLPGLRRSPEATFNPNAEEVKLSLELTKKNNNRFIPGEFVIHARAWEGKVKHRVNPEAAERAEAERQAKEEAANQLAAEIKSLEESKAAESALVEARKRLEKANQAKEAAAKRAEDAKKRAQPRDLTHAFLSPPLRLHIADGPLRFANLPPVELSQGGAFGYAVKLERLYGFADSVALSLLPPKGEETLFGPSEANLAKESAEVELPIKLGSEAKPGTYEATLQAKLKFNGLDLTMNRPVAITVTPSSTKSS